MELKIIGIVWPVMTYYLGLYLGYYRFSKKCGYPKCEHKHE